MEFVDFKREKKRKKRRRNLTKKYRDQIKVEVKLCKGEKLKTEKNDFIMTKKNIAMEANAFWENYKVAHEWRNRHNSIWWKSRCFALEYENHFLKETISHLVKFQGSYKNMSKTDKRTQQWDYLDIVSDLNDNKDEINTDDTFEFELNEDMMNFLAQSIRHKIELKNKKTRETLCHNDDMNCRQSCPNTISLVHRRNEDAKLLYGEATSRILAMETALQSTIEKHIDKSKPQYWPNIPIKL